MNSNKKAIMNTLRIICVSMLISIYGCKYSKSSIIDEANYQVQVEDEKLKIRKQKRLDDSFELGKKYYSIKESYNKTAEAISKNQTTHPTRNGLLLDVDPMMVCKYSFRDSSVRCECVNDSADTAHVDHENYVIISKQYEVTYSVIVGILKNDSLRKANNHLGLSK
jgi:hypothetical protein